MGSVVGVPRILPEIGHPHGSLASKRRCKYRGISRLGEVSERLLRCPGQGIEEILLAGLIRHVIEECPKFGLAQFPACIGNCLYELLEVEFGSQRCTHAMEDSQFLFALAQRHQGTLAFRDVLNGDERYLSGLNAPVQTTSV